MEVLESVTDVKREYQSLHADIKEVQQLQKEMTASLQFQLRTMHQTFKLLKKKIQESQSPASTPSRRWTKINFTVHAHNNEYQQPKMKLPQLLSFARRIRSHF